MNAHASFLLAVALASCAASAQAQPYPSKPIKVIVPYSAGGVVDVIARAVGERMSQTMGQPSVVENRVGAAGGIGTEAVARIRHQLLEHDVPDVCPRRWYHRFRVDRAPRQIQPTRHAEEPIRFDIELAQEPRDARRPHRRERPSG